MSMNIWELKILCSFVNPDVEEKEECERFWEYGRCPQDKGGGVGMGWVWKGGLLCTKLTFARVDNAIANGHTTPSCQSWRRCLRKFTILPNFTAIGANFQPPSPPTLQYYCMVTPLLPRNNSGVARLMIGREWCCCTMPVALAEILMETLLLPLDFISCDVKFCSMPGSILIQNLMMFSSILTPTSHNAITLLVTQSELD